MSDVIDIKKINDKSAGYRKGATFGLIGGVLVAMVFKKSLVIGGLIGLVSGGYIGYKVAEASESSSGFKNFGSSGTNPK